MPLYKTIHISQDAIVYIWKITESEEELRTGIELTDICNHRVSNMKSELHRRGFLSIRHLMMLEGYEDKDLFYDKAGKPHLHDGTHISISHSFEFTGIIISKTLEVGIDIEKQRDKITRIAHKFTTYTSDNSDVSASEVIKHLTLLWGAKESMYKVAAIPGLSFRQHIFIDPEFSNYEWFNGEVTLGPSPSAYRISYLEFEGFTCVYAIQQ